MSATRSEYGVLVPRRFNDGDPVPSTVRERIEAQMLDRFGGFTVVRDLVGAWRAPDGRRCDDRNDEYRLAAADEASLLAFAFEVGQLLGQWSVYVRCPDGRAVLVPVEDDLGSPARCSLVVCYGLPKEAVANLLRLPTMTVRGGELVLRFAYFRDELRFVRIVLADAPLSPPPVRTTAGLAVVSLTGTGVEVAARSEAELERVEAFLEATLGQFRLEPKEGQDAPLP
jgi:hypothetical protein